MLHRASARHHGAALRTFANVGTGVALRRVEMLLSELTIMYLAAAAPFGVARFVEEHERGSRIAHSILKSAAASLAWPAVVIRLLKRIAALRNVGAGVDESRVPEGQSVERVRQATVNALRAVEDLIASERGRDCEAQRRALFAARESVERYAGLALACASAREEAQPEARELELCRVAGRDGDDLLVAGRCLHRRNVTRLRAHRERARSELVHALAAAGEAAHNLYPSRPQFQSPQRASETAKLISEALLQTLSRVVELLSLFDEREAVVAVARLLDAECARLRRACSTPADAARDGAGEGEKSCTTRAAHTAFATPPLPTTTSTGG
ncbi:MAG TPA: hypothetical protein VLJ61_05825 [Pyrinomonadaceae bacterium]|nr:hypothetical protein [Pyrinomonadaceae bacterium]